MKCDAQAFCNLIRDAIIVLTVENGGVMEVRYPDENEVGELRCRVVTTVDGKKAIRFETTKGSRA